MVLRIPENVDSAVLGTPSPKIRQVAGPDSDPPVARDVTYVLDRPHAMPLVGGFGGDWAPGAQGVPFF